MIRLTDVGKERTEFNKGEDQCETGNRRNLSVSLEVRKINLTAKLTLIRFANSGLKKTTMS